MKGYMKNIQLRNHTRERTDFNDWNDPKLHELEKKNIPQIIKETEECVKEVPSNISLSSEVQNKVELEELREKIRKGHPLISHKEMRFFRLPFYESVLFNLKDDGFLRTYQFIIDIISLDDEWHVQTKNDQTTKQRPFLKDDVTVLKSLCNGLVKAEVAKKEGKIAEELKSFLSMAIHFTRGRDESWFWLAEELFEQCVGVDESITSSEVGRELFAISQYMYANFLLHILHYAKRSKHFVQESMKLSEGKNWNSSSVTGQPSDILYFESCLLLHEIYLDMAQENKECHFETAIELCRSALHWAKQVNCKSAEASALLSLIVNHIAASDLAPVWEYLESYMKLSRELNNIKRICEGFIMLAKYHELVKNGDSVVKDLTDLLKIAEENKLLDMTARAHRLLASFYLMKGKQKETRDHATRAYTYYLQLNKKHDIEETRCLTGVCQAQEIMPQYLSMLVDSETPDAVEFSFFMNWKSFRIPFFTEVKLFQPDSDANTVLFNKIEDLKKEEMLQETEAREAELKAVPSTAVRRRRMDLMSFSSVGNQSITTSKSLLTLKQSERNTQVS